MSADGLELLRLPDELGPPAEGAVSAYLRRLGVDPHAWSNAPGDRYAPHEHGYAKVLMCARGSITFRVGADASPVTLSPGDGFVLPPRTPHAAEVGAAGVTCLEGQRG